GALDGNETGNGAKAIVGARELCQLVSPQPKDAIAVQLPLLPTLEPAEESVPIGSFECDPAPRRWVRGTPAHNKICVARVGGQLDKRLQAWSQAIGYRQIDGVIALADIERSAVGLDRADGSGDQEVRIRITIAVRVGGQVVRKEIFSDLEKLRDGFAMVTSNARSKVLRGLDAAGCGLHRQARYRNQPAWPAGIAFEEILKKKDPLGRVGGQRGGISGDSRHPLRPRSQ